RTLLSPSRSRLRTLPLPPDAVDAQLAHPPLHRAASNMPELVGVFAVDRLPHLPHPVTGIVRLIDILDHHHQRPVPTGPGRGLTLLVCVIRAHSNPCSSPRQGSHDWLDSELVAIVVDEGDDHFDGRSSSAAKKADALFRISLALFASANSARNRRFSASRSTDSAGVALPESLCLRTQTRRVPLLNPSSFATRVIAPFAVSGSAWAWMTSSTARALSSSVYFTGKRESPSSNLPASIIPGAIHGILGEQLGQGVGIRPVPGVLPAVDDRLGCLQHVPCSFGAGSSCEIRASSACLSCALFRGQSELLCWPCEEDATRHTAEYVILRGSRHSTFELVGEAWPVSGLWACVGSVSSRCERSIASEVERDASVRVMSRCQPKALGASAYRCLSPDLLDM